MENKTAVIFCRVSTAPQAERWSLESQLQFNKKYAKHHALSVIRDFSIAESGWKDKDRREFYKMLELIEQNDIGNLLVLNVERLTRDYRGMVALDDLIERKGLRIHFTESNEVVDRDSPSDKQTFWAIKVAFARQFIKDLKDKARRSHEIRLDQGLYPSGNPPLGYESKTSHLTPDEKEVPYTQKAFELYATGMESENSVAEKLYEDGLRTRKGRKVGVDLYGGVRQTFGPVTVDVGGIYYEYPNNTRQYFIYTDVPSPVPSPHPSGTYLQPPVPGCTLECRPARRPPPESELLEIYAKPSWTVNDTLTLGGNLYWSPNWNNYHIDETYLSGTAKMTCRRTSRCRVSSVTNSWAPRALNTARPNL